MYSDTMSFLDELKLKRQSLKNTETVVTYADGRRFIDCKSGSVPIEDIKYGFVVDTRPDNKPSLIVDRIFIGSQDCCDPQVLSQYEIGAVLSVGIESTFDLPDYIARAFVECLDLPEANIIEVLRNCIPFINKSLTDKRNILIHCNAGVSRSSAVVIGFLILERNFTYLDAYNIVKMARNCIKPNDGFEKQLRSYEIERNCKLN